MSWNLLKKRNSKASAQLSKVGKGFCQTSVNTSIFRQSSVISYGDWQFCAYYDKKGRVVLAKRKLDSRKWQRKTTRFRGNIKDAHNVISLGIDGEGYLHMAFDMHSRPLKYARSIKPFSLKMSALMPMNGVLEDKVTYPEFYTLENGDLLFAYRYGCSGNGNMVLKRYSVKDKNWQTIHENLLDGEGERNAYWKMIVDTKGWLHLSWVWREAPDVATNHDLCYAKSLDGGLTWQKSDGTEYELPIRMKNSEVAVKIPQNSELINQSGIGVDEMGHPFISAYWKDPGNEVPHYRLVWNDGEKWRISQVGKRTKTFTLKGRGTKMVSISRPQVLVKDKEVFYLCRDFERGSRVSMAHCKDITNPEWEWSDLTDFSVDAWEPTFDINLWNYRWELNLFVQTTHQGDGERPADHPKKSSKVYIYAPNPPKGD